MIDVYFSGTLVERLRNLEKGYDRKFALTFYADEVWAALELLESMHETNSILSARPA